MPQPQPTAEPATGTEAHKAPLSASNGHAANGSPTPANAAQTPATAPQSPEFPVESFREAARHLRRPFTPAAVKFKVQATWPKDNPTGGLIVAYIDARLAIERLNLVVPHLWHDEYRPVTPDLMWCDLTVDGITRRDVGEGKGKGLVSDALKRAAVHFGIGVSLYAIPKMILKVDSGAVKAKQIAGKRTLEITPKGEQMLRDMYAHWLDAHGRTSFGEPLDHGDVEGAQGDTETETEPVVPAGVDPATGEVTGPTPEATERLLSVIRQVIDAGALTAAQIKTHLVAAGATDTSSVGAAISTLTAESAAELEVAMTSVRNVYLGENPA